ncbi:hypothetical protein [Streptomyces sp. enrichment culture]|uniref:hypothetical protein n=1 Tax=Streptomyces sp. enrichment culture TaxID=1795815 RepID=UPI003F5599A5
MPACRSRALEQGEDAGVRGGTTAGQRRSAGRVPPGAPRGGGEPSDRSGTEKRGPGSRA